MAVEVTTEEIPLTIDENPVTTVETTVEAPVTTVETPAPEATGPEPLAGPGAALHAAAEPLPAEVVALEPKRKPGRPAGSKNKEPGKPRKPRAKAVAIEPVVPVSVEPPPEEYLPLPGSRRIPTEARDSREVLMLRLLSEQAGARQRNKVALWKSWFL